MEIENQVCSMEQAEKLKELGVRQVSHFMWVSGLQEWEGQSRLFLSTDVEFGYHSNSSKSSAFTVAELSVMIGDLAGLVGYDKHIKKWWGEFNDLLFDTEAQAKANLLIKFLEESDDYINPSVVNERLLNS